MLEIGDIIQIHSYKHNGQLHRIWETSYVIEETEDVVIVGNKKTKVVEKDGRTWNSAEPSITVFYKKKWFNCICMLKKREIAFYVNLASPILYDDEGIKYIDYDLDVKISEGITKILDESEFSRHRLEMNYPIEIVDILNKNVQEIIRMVNSKEVPFNDEFVNTEYSRLLELI